MVDKLLKEMNVSARKYEGWRDQCTECGRTNRDCICDPRGGFFPTMEDKLEYYRTHPSSGVQVLPHLDLTEFFSDILKKEQKEK